jgi:SRSO17 transposase
VKDHKVDAVAAGASLAEIDVSGWNGRLEALFGRVAACFSDGRAWRQAQLYVVGLLSGAARKNGWTLAELAGDRGPQKMQRLLSSYEWDADEVRDVTRSYALEQLGEPDGVLVLDETGFLKKGTESVGVQRQYSGTAGRTENCQIGVFAAYVSAKGRCLVDRRIYLPKSWTDDPARCQGARVPDTVAFATKPALARDMVEDFLRVEPRLRWVAGDEVYGADPGLRDCLEAHNIGYVLGVACDRRVSTAAGAFTVSTLAAMVPDHGWETYSAADGSKGPRLIGSAQARGAVNACHLVAFVRAGARVENGKTRRTSRRITK